MHTIMRIEWSTSFPHRAMASARRGGMWHLTVRPRMEWPMFEWHIAHDTDGHLRGGFQNSRASLGATRKTHAAWSRLSTMKPSRS